MREILEATVIASDQGPAISTSIYRSDNLNVRKIIAGNSEICVVTFDNHTNDTNLDRQGFGENFLFQEGVSAIHVIGSGNDWYQYPDLPTALTAIRSHLSAFDRVFTYGSSMGGYAAIRTAFFLGADVALALSPQYSNDPKVTPWEQRWLDDAHRIRWLSPLAELSRKTEAILLFDPMQFDKRHAELIAKHTNCSSVRLPFAGHPVGTFLNEIGLLRQIVHAVRDNHFDAEHFTRQARSQRKQSSVYLANLASAQPKWRSRTAIDLAQRALGVAPDSPLVMHVLGMALSRSGYHDEAIAALESAVEATKYSDAHYFYWLAEALLAAGRYADAITQMDKAIALTPTLGHLWVWQAIAHAKANDWAEAMNKMSVAISLAPRRRDYRKRLWAMRGQRAWNYVFRPLRSFLKLKLK